MWQSEIKVLVAESMSHMYELSRLCLCAALHVYTSGRGLFERPLLVEDPVHHECSSFPTASLQTAQEQSEDIKLP